MISEYKSNLQQLKRLGWKVELLLPTVSLPEPVKIRYRWIPTDVEDFIAEISVIEAPGAKAWFLGGRDYSGLGSSAFAWNEWERLSLGAAEGNDKQVSAIRSFWDDHFTIAMSVKNGYAYFALRRSDLCIVCGEEPEFEETRIVASSLDSILKRCAVPDAELGRWV